MRGLGPCAHMAGRRGERAEGGSVALSTRPTPRCHVPNAWTVRSALCGLKRSCSGGWNEPVGRPPSYHRGELAHDGSCSTQRDSSVLRDKSKSFCMLRQEFCPRRFRTSFYEAQFRMGTRRPHRRSVIAPHASRARASQTGGQHVAQSRHDVAAPRPLREPSRRPGRAATTQERHTRGSSPRSPRRPDQSRTGSRLSTVVWEVRGP